MASNQESRFCISYAEQRIAEWTAFKEDAERKPCNHPVITVCMEPGSGGSLVAEKVAENLGFDYFHRDLLEVMSITAKVDAKILERLEKERLSGMEDVVSQMINDRYLYPGLYMEYLEKVVQTISRRGHAVVVGRGANFILPVEERLSVMVVAPRELRIQRIADHFQALPEDAEKRIDNRQKKRASFIRKNFNKDIAEPFHYDLTINTGAISLERAAQMVCEAWAWFER
ncbi:MAG: cytidylate kinase-like family protein [Desulfobacterales bacterium]|jgi:cytidylate kinase